MLRKIVLLVAALSACTTVSATPNMKKNRTATLVPSSTTAKHVKAFSICPRIATARRLSEEADEAHRELAPVEYVRSMSGLLCDCSNPANSIGTYGLASGNSAFQITRYYTFTFLPTKTAVGGEPVNALVYSSAGAAGRYAGTFLGASGPDLSKCKIVAMQPISANTTTFMEGVSVYYRGACFNPYSAIEPQVIP